jgi:hypothetical protein
MAAVDEIIANWIAKAERTGELKQGRFWGRPLDLDDGYMDSPPHLRMAHKVLKNAGYVPPEVELYKVLADLKQRLAEADDEVEAKDLRRQIAECRIKITMLIERIRHRRRRR